MLHPTLRELRAPTLEHPPRGLALVMGLITAAILIAGMVTLATARERSPPPPLSVDIDVDPRR